MTRHASSSPPSSHELHVLADRPAEVHFGFESRQSRVGIGASVGAHIAMAIIAIVIMRYVPERSVEAPPEIPLDRLIWLADPGPGGGGGGGGNKTPEPPRKAEVPGKDKLSVPIAPKAPAKPEPPKKEEPPPVEEDVSIPAKPLASAEQTLPGLIESPNVSATASQGTGNGGGAGTGTGTGMGSGQGTGLGEGFGGGTGGGAYRPGAGITVPRVLREVKPQYTSEAMRAKVQGVVWIECVVMPDGTVGQAKVIRSLDPVFGLDQEAIKAARQWRFVPGMRQNEPVPVIVTIELTFTLR